MSKRLCNIHGLWSKTVNQSRCPKCKTTSNIEYDGKYRDKKAKKVYDTSRWRKSTRPSVLVRDNYKCVKCGMLGESKDLVVDHIKELRDGGDEHNKENLQTLCKRCHKIKTDVEKKKRAEDVR